MIIQILLVVVIVLLVYNNDYTDTLSSSNCAVGCMLNFTSIGCSQVL